MSTRPRADNPPLLVGLALVAIGIVLLANQFVDVNDADLKDTLVFGGLAAVFLVALILTRGYGFLIAALTFAGLSAAKYAVMQGEDSGGAVLLGPGIGFLAAYAIAAVVFAPTHWWPLVPGTILTLLGGLLVFGGEPGAQLAGQIWPIVFVGIGVLVWAVFAAMRRRQVLHPEA
jgi:biotin transporter BioY